MRGVTTSKRLFSCHPASNEAKLQRTAQAPKRKPLAFFLQSTISVQHCTHAVSANVGIFMMADTWFILCATGKTLVYLCLVCTQVPATVVKTCCHLHLCFKQGTAIGSGLGLKGFTQLLTQRRCQWRRHCIANLAMLVVDIAPELEVIWEALQHTPRCFITDTGGDSANTTSTYTYTSISQEDT